MRSPNAAPFNTQTREFLKDTLGGPAGSKKKCRLDPPRVPGGGGLPPAGLDPASTQKQAKKAQNLAGLDLGFQPIFWGGVSGWACSNFLR